MADELFCQMDIHITIGAACGTGHSEIVKEDGNYIVVIGDQVHSRFDKLMQAIIFLVKSQTVFSMKPNQRWENICKFIETTLLGMPIVDEWPEMLKKKIKKF